MAAVKAPSRSITLVGFMGAGKSRVGRLLADQLGMAFVDTDKEIEADRGQPVSDIFAAEGEAAFRAAERNTIERLLRGQPKVIAVGGGAFVDPGNRASMNARSTTVWLDPPFDVLLSRLSRSKARPLALNKSEGELRALWEARRTAYAEAQHRIATTDENPQRFVDEIVAQLS